MRGTLCSGANTNQSNPTPVPIICVAALIAYYNKSPKKFTSSIVLLIAILASIVIIFNKPIQNRYNEALNDLNSYTNANSVTSLGARLAMYEIGLNIFIKSPFHLDQQSHALKI